MLGLLETIYNKVEQMQEILFESQATVVPLSTVLRLGHASGLAHNRGRILSPSQQ